MSNMETIKKTKTGRKFLVFLEMWNYHLKERILFKKKNWGGEKKKFHSHENLQTEHINKKEWYLKALNY